MVLVAVRIKTLIHLLQTRGTVEYLSLNTGEYYLRAQQTPELNTSVKLAPELGEITFSTGKPKLTPGEVPTFQEFLHTYK